MSKKVSEILLLFATLIAFAAALIFTSASYTASAAGGEDAIALTPVAVNDESVKYHYFELPTSLFADGEGILVSCKDNVEKIASLEVKEPIDIHAEKIYRHEQYYVALKTYSLSIYNGTAVSDTLAAYNVVDFDISSGVVYAITDGGLLLSVPLDDGSFGTPQAIVPHSFEYAEGTVRPTLITVCNGAVFITVDSQAYLGNKQDICLVNIADGELSTVIPQSDKVKSMSALDSTETVYVLTSASIYAFKMSDGHFVYYDRVPNDARLCDIFAYDDGTKKCLYCLDELNALCELSADIKSSRVLIASAYDAEGFFNAPYNAAVKHSSLYVANYISGKISVYGDQFSYIDKQYIYPVSVASDSKGALYVAHNYNCVSIKHPDGKETTVTLPETAGAVKQIMVNGDKTLYILAAFGLWQYNSDGELTQISSLQYKAITLSAGHEELYALTDSTVERLTSDGLPTAPIVACSASPAVISIAADIDGNIYKLTASGITRYDNADNAEKQFAFTLDGKPYTLGLGTAKGQIIIDAVKNSYIKPAEESDSNVYINAIVIDTYKHRVFVMDGGDSGLGIKLVANSITRPDVNTGDPLSYNSDARIIRKTLDDTPLFELPMETTSHAVKKASNVIVPLDQPQNTPREFFFVLVDDPATRTLKQGYMYKDALSPLIEYSAPPADKGKVYASNTPIYKWPSPFSSYINGEWSAVKRDTVIELKNFVNPFVDCDGNFWYRVILPGTDKEGYIPATSLSVMDYEPSFIRPAYNAEIIEYEGEHFAKIYLPDADGKMTLTDYEPLPAGTEIEVVGTYDTTVPYTQVKYFNSQFGTRTCYVETVHVKYTGTNVVLLVAVIVIVITVILAIIIIARVLYVKKKRLIPPSIEQDKS